MRTSAVSHSFSTSSTPSGVLVLMPTDRRPRASGSVRRPMTSSPGLTRSTRTTSGPRSDRIIVANGPGASPASSTTFRPLSGPAFIAWFPSERPGDDFLHDLAGSTEDPRDPDVGPGARDRVLGHVAVAAEELHAVVDHLVDPLGGPQLRHRRALDVELALEVPFDALVQERPRDGGFGGGLGELELGVLEGEDR